MHLSQSLLINEHFLDLFYVLAVSLASGMSVEEKRNLKHELKSLKMEDTFFIHGISGTRKEIVSIFATFSDNTSTFSLC